jgi:mRNA interferase MazF
MIEPRDRLLKPCQVIVDQPRALDKDRFGDGPLTILTTEEMAAVEHSFKGVMGLL